MSDDKMKATMDEMQKIIHNQTGQITQMIGVIGSLIMRIEKLENPKKHRLIVPSAHDGSRLDA